MALALIYDLDFPNKSNVIQQSIEFVSSAFGRQPDGRMGFYPNIVDDCFVVFNVCERPFLSLPEARILTPLIDQTVSGIADAAIDDSHWLSPPPFGGLISPYQYPTSVAIRALLSYYSTRSNTFVDDALFSMAEWLATTRQTNNQRSSERITPFWGPVALEPLEDMCFVLMPFSPKLSQIYQRYIKFPIEQQLRLRCVRADDIYRSSRIMEDIWHSINKARVVIAELTTKNANVFYELGMAHVLGKPVILIAQSIDDVPFDLRSIRTIIYDDSPDGYDDLTRQLLLYLKNSSS